MNIYKAVWTIPLPEDQTMTNDMTSKDECFIVASGVYNALSELSPLELDRLASLEVFYTSDVRIDMGMFEG